MIAMSHHPALRRWVIIILTASSALLLIAVLAALQPSNKATTVEVGAPAGSSAADGATPGQSSSDCAAPAPRPDKPSEEEWAAAEAAIREADAILARTGWARAIGESLVEDDVWICSWVQPGGTIDDAAALEVNGYRPLTNYDSPNGRIIGYSYGTAGMVPIDAPADFDIEAAIIERNGCADLFESNC